MHIKDKRQKIQDDCVYNRAMTYVHTIPLQSYVQYNDACCLIWFRYQPKRLNVGKFLDLWTGIWVSFAPKTYLGCWVSGTRQQDGRNFASMHTLDLSPNPSQYLVQFNAGCADFHWFGWCLRTLDSWLYLAWYVEAHPHDTIHWCHILPETFFENPNFG